MPTSCCGAILGSLLGCGGWWWTVRASLSSPVPDRVDAWTQASPTRESSTEPHSPPGAAPAVPASSDTVASASAASSACASSTATAPAPSPVPAPLQHAPTVRRGAADSAVPQRLAPVPRALVPGLTAPAPVPSARAWNRACTRAPCPLRQFNNKNLAHQQQQQQEQQPTNQPTSSDKSVACTTQQQQLQQQHQQQLQQQHQQHQHLP